MLVFGVRIVIHLRKERRVCGDLAVFPRGGFATVRAPVTAFQNSEGGTLERMTVMALPFDFRIGVARRVVGCKALARAELRRAFVL